MHLNMKNLKKEKKENMYCLQDFINNACYNSFCRKNFFKSLHFFFFFFWLQIGFVLCFVFCVSCFIYLFIYFLWVGLINKSCVNVMAVLKFLLCLYLIFFFNLYRLRLLKTCYCSVKLQQYFLYKSDSISHLLYT